MRRYEPWRRQADHDDGMTNPSVVKPSCCCNCNRPCCFCWRSSITRCLKLSSIDCVSSSPTKHSGRALLRFSIFRLNFSSVILVWFFLLSLWFSAAHLVIFDSDALARCVPLFFPTSSASELSGVVVSLRPVTWVSQVTWSSVVTSGGRSPVSNSTGGRGRRVVADHTLRRGTGGGGFAVEAMTALSGRIFPGRIVSYLSGRSVFHDTSSQMHNDQWHQY